MMLSKFIQKELTHFNRLGKDAKRLLISFVLYSTGNPLISTFTSAFIWKQSHDFLSVALYNIGNWTMLPFAFYLNGFFIKYFRISVMYTIGLLLTALAPFIIIMLGANGYAGIFVTGLVFGLGYGLYWSNRNFYSLRATQSHNRNYFFSTAFAVDTLVAIMIPFLIGWFIVFTGHFAYQLLAVILFLLYAVSGILTLPVTIHANDHIHGLLKNPSRKWWYARISTYIIGLQSGTNYVLPGLLVLSLLGNEGILGTVVSFGSLLSAIATYQVGKHTLEHHRFHIILTGIIILVSAALIYTFFPPFIGIIAYVAGTTIAANFVWSAYNPVLMDVTDQCSTDSPHDRYKYIVDDEIFLNLGRITGIGLFFTMYYFLNRQTAIHIHPIIIAAFEITVLVFIRKLVGKKA